MRDRKSFPLKDLTGRKTQTGITILGLSMCVSLTVFLVSFGETPGVEVFSLAIGSVGLVSILSRFIVVVIFLNIACGVAVSHFLISLSFSHRARDVGIMKAVGSPIEAIFNFFSIEVLTISLVSCVVGCLSGLLANLGSVGLMNLLGFPMPLTAPNLLHVLFVFFFFVFIYSVSGMRCVTRFLDIEPTKALSPVHLWKPLHHPSFKTPTIWGKSLVARISLRDLSTRKSVAIQVTICLILVMALSAVAVVGGVVANQTTQTYVERAIGRNVVLVADEEIADRYEGYLQSFFKNDSTCQEEKIDYLNEVHMIPHSFISGLERTDGVLSRALLRIDPRLVVETDVHGCPVITIDPDMPKSAPTYPYHVVGEERSCNALIVGVHPERLISNWIITG